ncbi:MAG TPA: preprotein translocase subunit SecG [Candidatus Dormibacteraeota bacterium]|jgi:preprotein translocase subunit SecG|nr:preprotein translocase subunit SecG [Candidatus Dormibacteraeota bacterium]
MPGWMKWGISLLIGFGVIVIGFRFAGWLLTTFFVMNCLVLVIVVLLQSGKAADLAGAFGGAGSQTAFGPRGAATILSQATTWCAVMFMVCAMALVLRVDRSVGHGNSVIYNTTKPASKPATAPGTSTPAPGTSAPATQTPAPNSQPTQQPQQQAPAPPTPQKK